MLYFTFLHVQLVLRLAYLLHIDWIAFKTRKNKMTLQKIEFEYDIPDGYRFVRYGIPKKGEACLADGRLIIAESIYGAEFPIVEKITQQPKRKHADLIHAWAEGAEIQYSIELDSWHDVIDKPLWNEGTKYRIKPKTKTVRFRNFMHTIGSVMATDKDISNEFYFAKWLGDWQEAEVEE